jgi:hypothetical protein
MADSTQWEVEESEARDPATPPARLAELIGKHLEGVLANPGFAPLLVEQPAFWALLGPQARSDVLASPACPVEYAEWLLMKRSGLVGLDQKGSCDSRLSPAEFERLAAQGVLGASLAATHPGVPAPLVQRLSEHSSPFVYGPALANPSLAPALLAFNLTSPERWRRRAAAENPAMTPAQFEAAQREPQMRLGLARNPGLSGSLIEGLLRDTNDSVRVELARNACLSAEAQLVLAEDLNAFVLEALGENPSLTAEARARLEQRKMR